MSEGPGRGFPALDEDSRGGGGVIMVWLRERRPGAKAHRKLHGSGDPKKGVS
jgi:hypothetical protein